MTGTARRILLDENMPRGLAEGLVAAGHGQPGGARSDRLLYQAKLALNEVLRLKGGQTRESYQEDLYGAKARGAKCGRTGTTR